MQVAAAAAAELTGFFAAAWNRLGLDLASVAAHTPERLLSSILDPNANNPPRYAAFTCTLQDGE